MEGVGQNETWYVGHNAASLHSIYNANAFMNEAHVHGFVNLLERERCADDGGATSGVTTVVVIDERHEYL